MAGLWLDGGPLSTATDRKALLPQGGENCRVACRCEVPAERMFDAREDEKCKKVGCKTAYQRVKYGKSLCVTSCFTYNRITKMAILLGKVTMNSDWVF